MRQLYRPLFLIETPILFTSLETAELTKYAANAFLAVKISYINQIADLCEKVNADVHDVAKGMGLDKRIGGKFLHPGPGYGGSCFPKDTLALVKTAELFESDVPLVSGVVSYNSERKQEMAQRVIDAMQGDVAGKKIAILGLAFQYNISCFCSTDDGSLSTIWKFIFRVGRGLLLRLYGKVPPSLVMAVQPTSRGAPHYRSNYCVHHGG